MNNTLFIIPARSGSKGVAGKNIKELGGKPLIYYSIDFARKFTDDANICVSTDGDEIIEVVEKYNLEVPFKRPTELATDTASTNDVLLHALNFYKSKGVKYDQIALLQPTSPFRKKEYLETAFANYSDQVDMVTSVVEAKSNPYYVMYEEDEKNCLQKLLNNSATRRQDTPKVYELNGSLYLINIKSLEDKKSIANFTTIKKVVMDAIHSVDIDTPLDWMYCEFLIEKELINV